jgi:hypothetical protein
MKLAAFFAFAPLAFCQAPPEVHLFPIEPLPQIPMVDRSKSTIPPVAPAKPQARPACAIPLAQALPRNEKTDYKMPILTPAEPAPADVVKIGADPCPAPAR